MKKFKFYILHKDINSGEMIPYDVMPSLYGTIFNSNGTISKKNFYNWSWNNPNKEEIKNRDDLKKFIDRHFRYLYWSKCEWEFIASDWPPCSTKDNRDKKIDGYQQLEPNIDLITDIVWEQIKNKIK